MRLNIEHNPPGELFDQVHDANDGLFGGVVHR